MTRQTPLVPVFLPTVTVVTPTNLPLDGEGVPYLVRSIKSVMAQDYLQFGGKIKHVVVGDNVDPSIVREHLGELPPNYELVTIKHESRNHDRSSRVAELRNRGGKERVGLATAYVDCDNTLEIEHVSDAMNYLISHPNMAAVHSWHSLWYRDGVPFDTSRCLVPWDPDESTSRATFLQFEEAGELSRSDNIQRDRTRRGPDTGCMVVRNTVLDSVEWPETAGDDPEDTLFWRAVLAFADSHDMSLGSTERATMRHYLATNHDAEVHLTRTGFDVQASGRAANTIGDHGGPVGLVMNEAA